MASRDEISRLSGANWALEKAKEKGIEGLEQELKMRGAIGLPLAFSENDKHKCEDTLRRIITDALTCVITITLRDEFGFGKTRLDRFIERFNDKIDCLEKEYCNWNDIVEALKDEVNVEVRSPEAYRG